MIGGMLNIMGLFGGVTVAVAVVNVVILDRSARSALLRGIATGFGAVIGNWYFL